MKTNTAVLWQLFGAIAVGIIGGVLVGYRTNALIGFLFGIALTFLLADWGHVWKTLKEFVKKSRPAINWERVWAKIVKSFPGYFSAVCHGGLITGAFAVGLTALFAFNFSFSMHLSFVGDFLLPTKGRSTVGIDFIEMFISAGFFSTFAIFAGYVFPYLFVIDEGVQSTSYIRLPFFRRCMFPPLNGEDGKDRPKENGATSKALQRTDEVAESLSGLLCQDICRRDSEGNLLNRKRLFLLTKFLLLLVILPTLSTFAGLIGVLIFGIFLLDSILTGLLALATSRNMIASLCTAIGIVEWFVCFPEEPNTVFAWVRLVCFACAGGAAGVGIYKLRLALLSIPIPELETRERGCARA